MPPPSAKAPTSVTRASSSPSVQQHEDVPGGQGYKQPGQQHQRVDPGAVPFDRGAVWVDRAGRRPEQPPHLREDQAQPVQRVEDKPGEEDEFEEDEDRGAEERHRGAPRRLAAEADTRLIYMKEEIEDQAEPARPLQYIKVTVEAVAAGVHPPPHPDPLRWS